MTVPVLCGRFSFRAPVKPLPGLVRGDRGTMYLAAGGG